MNHKKEKPSQWVTILLIGVIILSVSLSILILCIWTTRDLKRANKKSSTTKISTTFSTSSSDKIATSVSPKTTETIATTDSHIQILLKNKDSIFYKKIYLTADCNWYINDTPYPPNQVQTVDKKFLKNFSNSKLTCTCPDGLIYFCDQYGNKTSSGYEGFFYISYLTDTNNDASGITIVNDISIEDYVRYVLPSEMPSDFQIEALKAQAICARTYAYSMLDNQAYINLGADIDDSTSYQVYNAIGTTTKTDQAVNETTGEILTSTNLPITCYYYSTSPGFTSSPSVWGDTITSLPYIGCVSTIPSQSTPYNLSTDLAFDTFIKESPVSYDSQSPFYRWTAVLDSKKDGFLYQLDNIKILKRNESGYITLLQANISSGNATSLVKYIGENEIRKFLGQYLCKLQLNDASIRTDFQMLPSSCFEIIEQSNQQFILYGGGFGHGVGFSQYGANGLAAEGKTYKEILDFFFKNTSIQKKPLQP